MIDYSESSLPIPHLGATMLYLRLFPPLALSLITWQRVTSPWPFFLVGFSDFFSSHFLAEREHNERCDHCCQKSYALIHYFTKLLSHALIMFFCLITQFIWPHGCPQCREEALLK